jgi:hypothetical protein
VCCEMRMMFLFDMTPDSGARFGGLAGASPPRPPFFRLLDSMRMVLKEER